MLCIYVSIKTLIELWLGEFSMMEIYNYSFVFTVATDRLKKNVFSNPIFDVRFTVMYYIIWIVFSSDLRT